MNDPTKNQALKPSKIEKPAKDGELSVSELDTVAGGDCYLQYPRGSSPRETELHRTVK